MIVEDLSTFARQLRQEGFEARNLGQVGITIWQGPDGYFIPADELKQLPRNLTVQDFQEVLDRRRGNGHS